MNRATAARSLRGARARREGRRSEWLCVLWLMLRGYRILGFRLRLRAAEIDVLALKAGVVAVIEVKRRRTLEEAREAVSWTQRQRLTAAACAIASRRPDLAAAPVRLDLIALAPGRWPRHIANAWPED
ncbi:MAG TPA: YraN family protein [Caulobacteraceae bacterium]|nr:YraN family protein [Caulobacteraceae bacterium]